MHNILLNNTIVGKQFHYLPICHSTNDMVLQMVKEGKAANGLVLMAGEQISGKGQRGNVWKTEANKNLTFSLVINELAVKVSEQFLISMAVACGIQSFLQSRLEEKVFVKWPNDIIIGNKKVAGILIENGLKGSLVDYSIIGIGLNINQKHFEYTQATSLAILLNKELSLDQQLVELCQHLDKYIVHLLSGNYDQVKDDYLRSLFRLDEVHQYRVGTRVFHGKIIGINLQGQLLIDSGGITSKYNFKEIEFVLQ